MFRVPAIEASAALDVLVEVILRFLFGYFRPKFVINFKSFVSTLWTGLATTVAHAALRLAVVPNIIGQGIFGGIQDERMVLSVCLH